MTHLQRLLDATPLPPATREIDELLTAFALVHAAREAILAELANDPPVRDAALMRELVTRNDAWRIAIEDAKRQIAGQLVGVGKLRTYAVGL
jgi:DICT domain-containing protein